MTPPLPELPGVQHRFVDLRTGVRVHVAEAGPADAPPVLALHGWPQHWWMWRRVLERLDGDFRLLCPDLRGFGWSGWPRDGDFRKARLAEDALALLDAEGLGAVHVMGHDWGGWAALLLGLDAPDRVRSLLMLSIGHPWQPPGHGALNAWRLAYQPPIAAPFAGPALIRQGGLVRAMLRAGFAVREALGDEAVELYLAAVTQPAQAEASSRLYRSFLLSEAPAIARGTFAARRLAMPARLVYGERDAIGAFAAGLERHGDDAASEAIPGCGHFLPEERPDVVADRARSLFGRAS